MKKVPIIAFIGARACTLTAADSGSKDKVTTALKQLAEKPNYSWTTTTKEGDGSSGRLGPMEGKAEKGGVTYLSFTVSEVPVVVYMKGEKGNAKALEGLQTFVDNALTIGTAAAIIQFLRS